MGEISIIGVGAVKDGFQMRGAVTGGPVLNT
ncbi:hypothetical protein SAMN05216236_10869 [Sedimentitalea nanhaiensis]|uniref:Uncharacterized protein n=1 Tax=Sedimentitalea nanhaiensis TaxID=999627 RepID=A0A1I7B141_9RHOB|nr:hypothetical protein SAMN05216236_10869 [Sedimentitalea nanhaiensis]